MNKWYIILFALPLLFGSAWVVMADPLDFTLPWTTVDGGGSAISAAPYALHSSIGQPDVGLLQGGSYTIKGGFWGSGLTGPTSTPSPTLPPVTFTPTSVPPTLTPTASVTPGGPTLTPTTSLPTETPTRTPTRTPPPTGGSKLYLPLVKSR